MNKELYDEAIRSNILSRKLIEQLMESMNYSSISFINWTVEVLKIIKTRLERGDKITDEVSGITYDIKSFRNFVSTNFSSYITSQVFDAPDKAEKVYFSLEATEDGHQLMCGHFYLSIRKEFYPHTGNLAVRWRGLYGCKPPE